MTDPLLWCCVCIIPHAVPFDKPEAGSVQVTPRPFRSGSAELAGEAAEKAVVCAAETETAKFFMIPLRSLRLCGERGYF